MSFKVIKILERFKFSFYTTFKLDRHRSNDRTLMFADWGKETNALALVTLYHTVRTIPRLMFIV